MPLKVLTTKKKPLSGSPQPWKPVPYMVRSVKFLLEHCNAGLFLDPGLRKTSITLAAIKVLLKEEQVRRVLVIAPKRVCHQVWPAERTKWQDFNHLRMQVLHGVHKDDALEEDADIYVINPEGLPWLMAEGRFKRLGCDMLVIDESSKFRHTNTQRFKLLKPVLTNFSRRVILTGSPNPKSYLDLFGQIYILDLGHALGQYITHYRIKYFYSTGYGGYTWLLQTGADKLIQKQIKPLVLRLDADDYIKMPKPEPNIIRVELPPAARKVYDAMEEEMLADLASGKTVTAKNAAVASMKCCQVASGGLYHQRDIEDIIQLGSLGTGRRTWETLHNEKTEALVDLIDELQGSPLLVGYEFEHDLDRITKALGAVPNMGTASPKDAIKMEAAWNAGDIPVMLGNPAAMAHGLNLQESSRHVAFYTLPWDFELYDQFIRRIRRSGNTHDIVFVHHFVARNTVDEAKLRSLRTKGKNQQGLLDALRSYAKSRGK